MPSRPISLILHRFLSGSDEIVAGNSAKQIREKVRGSLAPFSEPESSVYARYLVVFITITCGFRFSVHTAILQHALGFSAEIEMAITAEPVTRIQGNCQFLPSSGAMSAGPQRDIKQDTNFPDDGKKQHPKHVGCSGLLSTRGGRY